MRVSELEVAMEEARRFLARAEAALEAEIDRKRYDWESRTYVHKIRSEITHLEGGKASGALRRSSMDLTRSLADLRRAV